MRRTSDAGVVKVVVGEVRPRLELPLYKITVIRLDFLQRTKTKYFV